MPAVVTPFSTIAHMTPNNGMPCAKLNVPSIGSSTKANSAVDRPSKMEGSSLKASSPTTSASGNRSLSRAVKYFSARMSACVTRSMEDVFCTISPSSSLRKRGIISRCAASRIKPAAQISSSFEIMKVPLLDRFSKRRTCIKYMTPQLMRWPRLNLNPRPKPDRPAP